MTERQFKIGNGHHFFDGALAHCSLRCKNQGVARESRGKVEIVHGEQDAFAALAGNPNITNLRELDFQLNDSLSDDDAAALARAATRFTSLTKLEFWGTRMTAAARATLRGAFGNRVTVNGQPA